MRELVYDGKDVEDCIRKRYPNAIIKDASDDIHRERFQVDIPGVNEDDFYPFAIREGFAMSCLSLRIMTMRATPRGDLDRLNSWILKAKEMEERSSRG